MGSACEKVGKKNSRRRTVWKNFDTEGNEKKTSTHSSTHLPNEPKWKRKIRYFHQYISVERAKKKSRLLTRLIHASREALLKENRPPQATWTWNLEMSHFWPISKTTSTWTQAQQVPPIILLRPPPNLKLLRSPYARPIH